MRKYPFMLILLVIGLIICSPARSAFSKEYQTSNVLFGKWKMTLRPLDDSGKPCPFIPESIEFFKDQTLIMSSAPGQHFQFKTNLTADEKQSIEARFAGFKGESILLVKPSPHMDWRSTPMVYIYSVGKNELTLTVQGWRPAKFKLVK